jgi:hypothetical protein
MSLCARGEKILGAHQALVVVRGAPESITTDDGNEFAGRRWTCGHIKEASRFNS